MYSVVIFWIYWNWTCNLWFHILHANMHACAITEPWTKTIQNTSVLFSVKLYIYIQCQWTILGNLLDHITGNICPTYLISQSMYYIYIRVVCTVSKHGWAIIPGLYYYFVYIALCNSIINLNLILESCFCLPVLSICSQPSSSNLIPLEQD